MDIYKYDDYKKIIIDWIASSKIKGAKTQLSKSANCSPSWITRVLHGSLQLTPDQAMGVAVFLNFNEFETDYFMNLVDLERAATPRLKKQIEKKLNFLRKNSIKVGASVQSFTSLDSDSFRYYSSWVYASVHVACMIKKQKVEEISERLNLSMEKVIKILHELKKMNLVTNDSLLWFSKSNNIHLPEDYQHSKITHSIWRNRVIQFLNEGHDEGLHYSGIHCLSAKDVDSIQRQLKEQILNCRLQIQDSPSEELVVFCLDWFKI